ncbi:MAG: right-handed parallel beta-helix repeat-containing protein [Planctomycetota bacterium]
MVPHTKNLCTGLMCTLLIAVVIPPATADIWVDQDSGNDRNPGTQASPLATIATALDRLSPGQTLHVLPNNKPWPGDIRVTVDGTKENPITLDGHGSRISNRRVLPNDAWKRESDGVYSRSLPNNAWGMETHWEGEFPLVWFRGRAATNVTTRDQLHPGSYFLYKNRANAKNDPLHNTLFIQLPTATSLADVESIAGEGGLFVGGDHVIVRNFVAEYGGRDGFATHRNQGVVFENVEARFFMDQGISNHGAEAIVRDSHFHHNAGAGIVDVYPESNVRYEACVIENNTWRGGVELHAGRFHLVDCVIRHNRGQTLVVTKGATAVLERCLLIGGPDTTGRLVRKSSDSSLTLDSCTLTQGKSGGAAIDD